jgi:hypothetical protein
MNQPKDKPPWFQQHGSHIDSLPVEKNLPLPNGTHLIWQDVPVTELAASTPFQTIVKQLPKLTPDERARLRSLL